jgi:hypothetical protein
MPVAVSIAMLMSVSMSVPVPVSMSVSQLSHVGASVVVTSPCWFLRDIINVISSIAPVL